MKLSEAIQELQDLKTTHGDLELVDDDDNSVDFEFNDDGDDQVIVVA